MISYEHKAVNRIQNEQTNNNEHHKFYSGSVTIVPTSTHYEDRTKLPLIFISEFTMTKRMCKATQ